MNDLDHDLESTRRTATTSTMNGNPFVERSSNTSDELIDITDNRKLPRIADIASSRSLSNNSSTAALSIGDTSDTTAKAETPALTSIETSTTRGEVNNKKRVHFKSLLATSAVINKSDGLADRSQPNDGQELINFNNLNLFDESPSDDNRVRSSNKSNHTFDTEEEDTSLGEEDEHDYRETTLDGQRTASVNNCDSSPSRYKYRNATPTSSSAASTSNSVVGRLATRLKSVTTGLANKLLGPQEIPYAPAQESDNNKDLLTGATKYKFANHKRRPVVSTGRTFRGSYKYSRIGIVMAIFKKLISFLGQKSTLALIGAFLIHVTLGTVYTLSNINSYLTSYMRKHGTPNATYGGSMWISSSYAVGQGVSMVLGGYLERRFSARLSCFLGCALHSLSIMSTSKSIDHGHLAVLVTYGFLPGFGCGLAYMTPMSNGFGWFPNRKGLVAGVILAGFGIGTFVFNMAQTAFVNPENLSPMADSGGYFTQESILNRVPQLFVFLGCIYGSMQFIGCCLLFKPPSSYDSSGKMSDTKPILVESEMSFQKAVRSREFIVLFLVFGITNQGVLFVNSMLKEYGQIFINNDLFLAWTGSMASIANSLGRLTWGLAIDRFSFTQCFTAITTIFGTLMFLMPFEFILSSKLLYLLCTLGIFGSFSGWMSTYPVHLSRVFGVHNSGIIYGLIFVSQSIGGIFTAFGAHYLIDNYSRFVPFFCVAFLEVLGLAIYHLFYSE